MDREDYIIDSKDIYLSFIIFVEYIKIHTYKVMAKPYITFFSNYKILLPLIIFLTLLIIIIYKQKISYSKKK